MKRWTRGGLRIVGLALVLALVAAACGGGSEVTKEELVAEFVGEDLFTQEQAECFVDAIWDDFGPLDIRQIESQEDFSPAQAAALTEATFSCIDVGDLIQDPPPVTDLLPTDRPPGTDAELDAFWVACGGGDAEACDDLFIQSPLGSDYEEFGRTCGGRRLGSCVSAIADS